MAQKRVSMSKVREIIRLYEETELSYRKIGRALKISHPVVRCGHTVFYTLKNA